MESLVILLAVVIAFFAAFVIILRKTDHSGWWILFGFVPTLNLIMLLVFALRRWPIQEELVRLRAMTDTASDADFDALLSQAVSTEKKGAHGQAAELFELIVTKTPDLDMKAYAADSLKRLKAQPSPRENSDNPYKAPRPG